ncbi:MAG: hypothetical protein IJR99_14530, partial [Kiritimatiellae bacterium]|nr:hypothetical protein [Kiritimatiellia bacterium]
VFIHLTQMVKRRFHSFLLTDIHLCDLCVLCGKKYRGGEVSTEEYRFTSRVKDRPVLPVRQYLFFIPAVFGPF